MATGVTDAVVMASGIPDSVVLASEAHAAVAMVAGLPSHRVPVAMGLTSVVEVSVG